MNNSDYRVRYTKMMLQQALMEALLRKSIDQVTITELCEAARINRGTFYLHYATPNDLLMEIEKQFLDENMAYFSPYMENTNTNQLSAMFECILKNREICRIIMGKNGNPRFLERLKNMIRGSVVNSWHTGNPDYKRTDLDYIFDYVFAGSMQLILSWLEDESSVSIENLARRLDRLGHYCQMALADF